MLVTAGSPLSRSACFASTAPTKPTGRPMTRAGAGPRVSRSARAVGAVPTTHTAPGPTSLPATRMPAAARVMPSTLVSAAACGSAPAYRLAGGDPRGRHRRVGDHRRTAAQRRRGGGEIRFRADEITEVAGGGAGVDDPFHHGRGAGRQRRGVPARAQDLVGLLLYRVHYARHRAVLPAGNPARAAPAAGSDSVIASAGQISMHSPHPVHRSARTIRGPPAGRIACSGQVRRHAPHTWQARIITGAAICTPSGSPSGRR